ncbi:hypothetical protein C0Q70_21498 [Pomacea canaliculata]|uniref:Uncharacterized protein n=1 Tax=Pomacea canaliculata TaxID=400727 RepID=A0A2T7NCP0_POMCA|nr:hypothetical protein C0Q70_21498 [Pomacea canaliculata]
MKKIFCRLLQLIASCPTHKTQLQESEVCYSSKKGIDQQQTLNQEDIVGVDVLSEAVVSSHFSVGSTTPDRDTAARTEDLGVTLSSARTSKNSSVIANVSAVQMSANLKDASRRDAVLVSEVPGASSPGSCLSPTDSCSDSGGLSFRSMIELCDTQALEFTPCVYHGVDSMSTSGSSTEMIFSTSSSRCVDRAYDEDNSWQTSSIPASVGMSVVPLTLSTSTLSHPITNTMTSVVHVAVSRSESILHGGHTSSIIYSGSSSDHMRVVSSDQLGSIPSDHVQHQSVIFADNSRARECMLTTTKEYTEEHSGDVTTKLKEKITRDESTTMTSTEKNCLEEIIRNKNTITSGQRNNHSVATENKLKENISRHQIKAKNSKCLSFSHHPGTGREEVKGQYSSKTKDIEKICHDDQYVKVTKKPHQPVTLTSVKDSVMKFETSSKSKGTVSARPGKAYVTTNRRSVSPLPKVLPDPPAAATSTGVGQTGSLLSTGCKSERMTSNHLTTSGSTFEIHIEAVVSSEDGAQPESRAASGDVTMCSSGSVTVTWPTCSVETELTSHETERVQNSPRPGDGSSVYAPPQQKSDADDFHSLSGEIPSEQTRVAINRTCDPPPPVLTEAPSAPTEYMPRMAAATGTNTPSEAAPLRGAEECTASTEEPPSDSVVSLQDLDGLSAVTNCLMSAGGVWRIMREKARTLAECCQHLPATRSTLGSKSRRRRGRRV